MELESITISNNKTRNELKSCEEHAEPCCSDRFEQTKRSASATCILHRRAQLSPELTPPRSRRRTLDFGRESLYGRTFGLDDGVNEHDIERTTHYVSSSSKHWLEILDQRQTQRKSQVSRQCSSVSISNFPRVLTKEHLDLDVLEDAARRFQSDNDEDAATESCSFGEDRDVISHTSSTRLPQIIAEEDGSSCDEDGRLELELSVHSGQYETGGLVIS